MAPAAPGGGFENPTPKAANQKSDTVAMVIVCLFNIFISPPSLLLSDLLLVSEQINARKEAKR